MRLFSGTRRLFNAAIISKIVKGCRELLQDALALGAEMEAFGAFLKTLGFATSTTCLRSSTKRFKAATLLFLEILEFTGIVHYRYRALDRTRKEIRLLILEPGSGADVLRCTLKHAFLDISPPPLYETISYVCGDPSQKSMIILHGREVQAMASSEAALRRMRLHDRPRVLWIDSICIDQNNISEKGHQVGMMYLIYTKTFQNLIWLGPYDGTTARLIDDGMAAIVRDIAHETRDYEIFRELLFTKDNANRFSKTPLTNTADGIASLQLFENPWFSRLWVVQEASLAPYSICHFGELDVPLVNVLRSAKWLYYKWFHLPKPLDFQSEGLINAESMFNAVDKKYGLFHTTDDPVMNNCFWQFGNLGTSNRRDCLFAILGLWQMLTKVTVLPDILKPDYTLSVCKVFTNGTKFAIQESGELGILEMISEPTRAAQDLMLPSWVPVLDQRRDVNCMRPFSGQFNVSNSIPMEIFDDNERTNDLVVSGVLLNSITQVGPEWAPGSTMRDFQIHMADIERPYGESWTGDHMEDLKAKISVVLIGGVVQFVRVTDQEALRGYESLKEHLEEYGSVPGIEHGSSGLYYASLAEAAYYRAVFHTKDGHTGLGPRCAQSGDIVAILYGCVRPMVMRPLPEPGTYRLLGTSYVYGIMDGEAIRRLKETGGKDTVFRII